MIFTRCVKAQIVRKKKKASNCWDLHRLSNIWIKPVFALCVALSRDLKFRLKKLLCAPFANLCVFMSLALALSPKAPFSMKQYIRPVMIDALATLRATHYDRYNFISYSTG